jgi:hypothetical protein
MGGGQELGEAYLWKGSRSFAIAMHGSVLTERSNVKGCACFPSMWVHARDKGRARL